MLVLTIVYVISLGMIPIFKCLSKFVKFVVCCLWPGANRFIISPSFLAQRRTAYGSAGIAIGASALVILLSSRSLVMTVFSVMSIAYVLASVTSMMVAAGWTLGFLESICFAILIGVSVDFVIHFSHAYVALPGNIAREIRTKHALIDSKLHRVPVRK